MSRVAQQLGVYADRFIPEQVEAADTFLAHRDRNLWSVVAEAHRLVIRSRHTRTAYEVLGDGTVRRITR